MTKISASVWGRYGATLAAFLLFELALILYFDRPVAQAVHDWPQTHPELVAFFQRLTALGNSAWYLWPSGLLLIFMPFLSRAKDMPPRYRHLFGYIGVRALFIFAVVAGSGLIADIFKFFIGRPRPREFFTHAAYMFEPMHSGGWLWRSLPSGHATTAFAFFCALAVFMPKGRYVFFLLAALVALSRVIVGAHYPADIVAGALVGALSVRLFNDYGMKRLSRVIFPIDRGDDPR